MSTAPPGLVVAAPGSGAGKTTVALGPPGTEVAGHEFHFAAMSANPDDPLVAAEDASGKPVAERGSRRGGVTGSFFHVIDRVA